MDTEKLIQDIEKFKSQPENAEFESFSKPGEYFFKQELEYKRELAKRFNDIAQRLLGGEDDDFFDELILLLSKVKLGSFQQTQNLLNFFDYGRLKKAIEESTENRSDLARHTRELLQVADDDESIGAKIDQFNAWLESIGLRAAGQSKRWATFFLFLWRPDKYIFIKPNFFDKVLGRYQFEKIGKMRSLDGAQYKRVMHNLSDVKTVLTEHLGETDYLGVQSFLWHVIQTLNSKPPGKKEFGENVWLLQPPHELKPSNKKPSNKKLKLDWDFTGTDDQVESYRECCARFQKDDILVFVDRHARNTIVGEARIEAIKLDQLKLSISATKLFKNEKTVSTTLDEELVIPGIVANDELLDETGMQVCQEYFDVGRWNFLYDWKPENFSSVANTSDKTPSNGNKNYEVGDKTRLVWKSQHATVGDPIYFLRTNSSPKGIIAKARICDVSRKGEFIEIEFEDLRAGKHDLLLTQTELHERIPEWQWSPGQTLKHDQSDIKHALRKLWISVLDKPINTILYGPPGTGKTFKLRNEYFPKYTGTSTIVSRKDVIRNQLNEMNWRTVIAATLLKVSTPQLVPDIVQHEYVSVKAQINSLNATSLWGLIWSYLQMHTPDKCADVNTKLETRQDPRWFWKNEDKKWELVHDFDASETGLQEVLSKLEDSTDEEATHFQRYDFVTFHQSYSYEEFVEGIRPKLEQDSEQVSYELRPGVFRELCDRARLDPTGARYAIFIDEINRGNISKIFGELITLIEEDKRQGGRNELSVTLPYSRSNFTVPRNLDIYGTMNTADRSLVHIDSALRRRFTFEELTPNPDFLSTVSLEGQIIDLKRLLKAMNERIEELFDREHMIGHAYFLKNRGETIRGDELPRIFEKKIIPLLTEYFFDDWSKVREVLADDEATNSDTQFVEHKIGTKRGKHVFRLNRHAFTNPGSYTKIYS